MLSRGVLQGMFTPCLCTLLPEALMQGGGLVAGRPRSCHVQVCRIERGLPRHMPEQAPETVSLLPAAQMAQRNQDMAASVLVTASSRQARISLTLVAGVGEAS